MIKIFEINKNYGEQSVLKGISLNLPEGEFIGIMGSSGSGKTSLMNIISTIDNQYDGKIEYNNIDISKLSGKQLAQFRNDNIGIIFQEYNLLESLTIYENIAIALSFSKIDLKEQENKIILIAEELGIADILEKYPNEVSGGQRQRTACARAMIKNPEIILADEPTGALDTASSKILMETLYNLNTKFGKTILMVTHDPLSASFCNIIYFIKDGKIVKNIKKKTKNRKDFYSLILNELLEGGDI